MPRVNRARRSLALLCALLVSTPGPIGPSALAQSSAPAASPAAIPEDAVNVRSMRGDVPPEIVRYLAKYAEGRKLTREAYPEAPNETAESLAKRFCGRVTDAYRGAFLTLNRRKLETFSFDAKLGETDAYSLEWPACLMVSAEGSVHIVRKGDNAANIYTELTGSAGGPDTRFFFFGMRPNLAKLKIGDELAYPWTSVTTQFRPRKDIADLDRQTFVDGLRDVVDALAKADADFGLAYVRIDDELLRDAEDAIPRIVTAADVGSDGTIAPPAECVGKAPGFSPEAVRKAFAEAKKETPQTVRVLVVDNGFFPARYDAETGMLTVRQSYRPNVALLPGAGRIGPQLKSGDITYTPILDPDAIPPDPISGHGSHVAGLILGGEAFASDRDFLANGTDSSWLKLSVANVGNGERYLPSNAADVLDMALGNPNDTPEIVNLSVVYTRRHAPRFNLIATTYSRTLFVVAAGNDDGQSVLERELYPAALGGRRQPNIITVASSRGDRMLATFSNVGDTAVDIAADGCMLSSWIDFDGESRTLSGSSQSAPLVAFTAAMVRALVGPTATPTAIKSRILISGDLLKPAKDAKAPPPVYSRSTLNIAKALYVRSDYIRFTDSKTGRTVTALGRLSQLTGAGCGEFSLKQFSAFKQEGGLLVGFRRDDVGVDIPCPAVIRDKDRVFFQIESEIGPDGTLTPAPKAAKRIDLVNVHEFVRRMPGFE